MKIKISPSLSNQALSQLKWILTIRNRGASSSIKRRLRIHKISIINYPASLSTITQNNMKNNLPGENGTPSKNSNSWKPITNWNSLIIKQDRGYKTIIVPRLLHFDDIHRLSLDWINQATPFLSLSRFWCMFIIWYSLPTLYLAKF